MNGLVAALSGVFSNFLVYWFESVKAPFIASALCLWLAAVALRTTWTENYGQAVNGPEKTGAVGNLDAELARPLTPNTQLPMPTIPEEESLVIVAPQSAVQRIFSGTLVYSVRWYKLDSGNPINTDTSLITLGITQTFYETAMYLFVFLWVPALQVVSFTEGDLPFGIIFSAFMCCMSFGSIIYGVSSESAGSIIHRHATLASTTCLVAAFALVTSAMSNALKVRFWAFCVFEATVGMYFPILGTLRGSIIPDETRASVSTCTLSMNWPNLLLSSQLYSESR